MQALGELNVFDQIVPLSAPSEDGVASFRDHVSAPSLGKHLPRMKLPIKPNAFWSQRLSAKLMRQLGDEILTGATVVIDILP